MARRITLLTSGTRGDVQPFVALALALQKRGLEVRLATHANFRPFVERYGLACTLIDGNPSELMLQQSGDGALAIQGGWLRRQPSIFCPLRARSMPACCPAPGVLARAAMH